MTRSLLIAVGFAAACATTSTQHVEYPDGSAHWEYQLKDGIPNGAGYVWYPKGSLRSEGNYLEGQKHGVFRYYDESGAFEHQALFVAGSEVWLSDDRNAEPPQDLLARLEPTGRAREEVFENPLELSRDPVPAPYFATLDPAGPIQRVGTEIGTGDIRRMALFANYAGARYGVYGQLLETDYADSSGMSYSGRRTLELGGTRRFDFSSVGTLTTRAGFVVPVGNDDQAGYIGSSIDAEVRPSDSAASFPSGGGARTGASLVRAHAYYVLQADAGVDWIVASQARPFDPVLHANGAVGIGVRAAMVSVQLSNAISMSSPSRHVDAAAVGATFWLAKNWLTGTYSHSFAGPEALTVAVGRDL